MGRIVDLTLTLNKDMRGVIFDVAKTIVRNGSNARTLHLYSHAGTHMDAPRHFDNKGETIDAVDLEACVGPAWVVDIKNVQDKGLITIFHLGEFRKRIREGDRVLLRTGWSRLADDAGRYRDNLPRISLELAEWFAEKKIRLLGVEPPSVADVNNREELTTVHRTLLEAGIVVVEGLANLDQLESDQVQFIALPLKLHGGDGAPARAIAIEG
ncbi:MAG: cyclase family protein [Chitinivibrionales bacterium]|nr:cyclase family protein [Chitinivibrionales bacterium]MBD3358561.1 cyclase family protein [Chitinivibrionales bacterium]